MLAAAIAGLTAVGCEVVDLGICPTPTVVHVTRRGTLAGAMTFVVLLTLGFVYDWRKGVFQWR